MKRLLLIPVIVSVLNSGVMFGQDIEILVSVKVIVNWDKTWPSGLTESQWHELLVPNVLGTNINAQDRANSWMTSYSRGYRFRITEVVPIGGNDQLGANNKTCSLDSRKDPERQDWHGDKKNGQNNSPSCWFNDSSAVLDEGLFGDGTSANPGAIATNPTLYQRRNGQVNFYVTVKVDNPADSGGWCPVAWRDFDAASGNIKTLVCASWLNGGPFWLVHETGHAYGLQHTFSETLGTLPDNTGWTQDQILQNARNTLAGFNMLPADVQQGLVDDTFFNVMSYHNADNKDIQENRLSELQLDRRADTANCLLRNPVNPDVAGSNTFVTGRTIFVSTTGSDDTIDAQCKSGVGSSTKPYRTVGKALTSAKRGDILLLRPGAYNQPLTISTPCTLRTTRQGPAAIGTATAP